MTIVGHGLGVSANAGPPQIVEVPVPQPGLHRYVQAIIVEDVREPVHVRHETEPHKIRWDPTEE